MALRVLLADESTTIKKVMQLALQDFAVEVRTVHVGLDVLAVAKAFKPDIIFADILLQKKNGYEVCRETKVDPLLKTVPVILMWSSFMQLDEELAAKVRADDRLEKPFDVESLRQVITKWSPKSKGPPPIASYLDFPDSIMEPLRAEELNRKPPTAARLERGESPPPPPQSANWNMEDFEDINKFVTNLEEALPDPEDSIGEVTISRNEITRSNATQRLTPPPSDDDEEEYQSIKLTNRPQQATNITRPDLLKKDKTATISIPPPTPPSGDDENEPWSIKGIDHFKLDLSREEIENAEPIVPEGLSLDDTESRFRKNEDPTVDLGQVLENPDDTDDLDMDPEPPAKTLQLERTQNLSGMDLSEEIKAAIERAVRDILPEIAERVVRQELKRILDEGTESSL